MNKYEVNTELNHNLGQHQIQFNNNDVKQIFVNKYLARYINIMEVKAQKYANHNRYSHNNESHYGSISNSEEDNQIRNTRISNGGVYKFMEK